jgi:hypothetical protein
MRLHVISLLLVFMSGCSQKVTVARNIHVKTNGYLGEALITCSGETDADVAVSLDFDGLATSPCPGESSHVYVEQNGKTTKAAEVYWTNSSEGTPDSVSIPIRSFGY